MSDLKIIQRAQNRRAFLRRAGATSAVVTFGSAAPWTLQQAAAAAPDNGNILVVVELAGGNDGLNTVIPHSDPLYKKARPKLGIKKADTLAIDENLGLHPSMRGFADLLEKGQFAVVQGVGYDNPNRSHFESMDIWHSCMRKDQLRTDGWLGRYLDIAGAGNSADPVALHLGGEKQPYALMSRDIRVPSIQSLEEFRLHGVDLQSSREAIRQLADQPRPAQNDLLGFVQSSTSNAISASERMESAAKEYKSSSDFPSNGLGQKLQTVAKLIASGLSTNIYYVRLDGFDTHANQPDAHAGLLRQLSDAISALITDMSAKGMGDRLTVMCFSEFGRRVAENASEGTDHGTAGPILLAGEKVKAGLIGALPSLSNLQDGDLKHHTDFRQVYAGVLEDWLNVPSKKIVGGNFKPIKMFG